jgi:hypothetical protein
MPLDVGLLMRIHSVFPAWLEPPMVAVTTLGCNTVVAVALAIAVGFGGYSCCSWPWGCCSYS